MCPNRPLFKLFYLQHSGYYDKLTKQIFLKTLTFSRKSIGQCVKIQGWTEVLRIRTKYLNLFSKEMGWTVAIFGNTGRILFQKQIELFFRRIIFQRSCCYHICSFRDSNDSIPNSCTTGCLLGYAALLGVIPIKRCYAFSNYVKLKQLKIIT